MIKRPEVIQLIRQSIDKYNTIFSHVEQIKKFKLLPHEWTITGGELTPTLKLKRKIMVEKYRAVIDELYS